MATSSHTQLRDICTRCFLELPADQDQVWTIGLTVTEELSGCISEEVYSSSLVVIFFSLHTKHDGDWVTPHPDLPLILNGEDICVTALLSHGSVIMVGGHTLTYKKSSEQISTKRENVEAEEEMKLIPPPKPKRSETIPEQGKEVQSPQDCTGPVVFDASLKRQQILEAKYDNVNEDTDLEKSMEIFMSLKESVINNDIELLSHIDTPEQVIGVSMSYLIQFCISNGLALSTREVDVLCKIINHVWSLQPQSLFEFLGGMKTKEIISEHDVSPFIKLLADLFLWSMDVEDRCEVCLKVISHLSEDPRICDKICKHNVISLTSACMSVYPNNVLLQTLACKVYTNVLEEWNTNTKCPIREAGVDFIVRAVKLHASERPFLRSAFRVLATLLKKQGSRDNDHQVNSNSVLDHIETSALPVVQDMARSHGDDISIHQYCSEILDYFTRRTSGHGLDNETLMGSEYRFGNSGEDSLHYEDIKLCESSDEDSEANQSNEYLNDEFIIISNDELLEKSNEIVILQSHNNSRINATTNLIDNEVYESSFVTPQNLHSIPHKQRTGGNIDLIDNEVYEASAVEPVKYSCSTESTGGLSHVIFEDMDKTMHKSGSLPTTDSAVEVGHYHSTKSVPQMKNKQNGTSTSQEEILEKTESNRKVRFKKKLGQYFSKLKPKGGKKNDELNNTIKKHNNFIDDSSNYVQFDQFDNSIDIRFSNSQAQDTHTYNSSSNTRDHRNSHEYDNSKSVTCYDYASETCESDSVDSEFGLTHIDESDSDSITAEFKLPDKAFHFEHNSCSSNESFGKPKFFIGNHSSMESIKGNMDHSHLPSGNSSRSGSQQLIHSGSDVSVTYTKGRKLSSGTLSITSLASTSSSLSNASQADSLPDTRSEYADHIKKSLESRTGKKKAWISALKKIYEKPSKQPPICKELSSKSCNNLSKIGMRYSLIENPKYDTHLESKNSKTLSTSQSVHTMLGVSNISIEEAKYTEITNNVDKNSDSKSLCSDDGNISSNIPKKSSKPSKFETLKLKNQRTRLEKFPWHSNQA